ncbi:14499_t:CDS:10 [Ambispora leptoticha]|uniref:2-(3-amino-3-carboxypropyl)histidine synthase subunit 2 n=1 Tax=Ambispora leptoticha TaxID=144679 RepID=A0A9N9F299_9GLOM|nr:14499_t:CDS:10 [Ambispora leptoticha]
MTSLTGPNNFSDDGRAVIERALNVKSQKLASSIEELQQVYEVERTISFLNEGGYKKVALQFPDELLADSTQISSLLMEKTNKQFFVLADTSYGSCCVDEIAAQHVDADCIIHYGRSCLSPTSRLPVLYVFGKRPIDEAHCLDVFQEFFEENKNLPIIVSFDVVYAHGIENFVSQLHRKGYNSIIQTFVKTETKHEATTIEGSDSSEQPKGRYYNLPEGTNIEDCSIFYIGGESLMLTNLLMTHNKCKVYTYNPQTREGRRETLQVNRALMKRYYMVQKAKDADVIGIVAGTLGVASYLTIISYLKKLITGAGKKAYTFVMGKLNVAKMANFMEIDCYVLVACPENSLIDAKEFYRPIVTPFELEIALDSSKLWTGEYITDFQQLLPGIAKNRYNKSKENSKSVELNKEKDKNDDVDADDDVPHYSLVTGQLKKSRKYAIDQKNDGDGVIDSTSTDTDVILRDKNTQLASTAAIMKNSAAAEFLNLRSFRGLEKQIGATVVSEAEEGRSGIARGYSDEK